MADAQSTSDAASTRRLLDGYTSNKDSTQTDPKQSLWTKLKAENEERKAKQIRYVSSEEAEAITGYGDKRVKSEEEERMKNRKKSGNTSFAALILCL